LPPDGKRTDCAAKPSSAFGELVPSNQIQPIPFRGAAVAFVLHVFALHNDVPNAVEPELLTQQAHRVDRGHADVRQLMVGRVAEQEGVAVSVAVGVDGFAGRAHRSIKPQPAPELRRSFAHVLSEYHSVGSRPQ